MKTKLVKPVLFLLAALAFAGIIASCSDDEDAKPADVTALQASVTTATTLLTTTTEGKNDGQYPSGSKATLQTAIDAAQSLITSMSTDQTAVDNAVVSLTKAIDDYKAKVITPIAQADLIAHWSFDEGTGSTAGDKSANKFDGTFKTGPAAWGAGFPVWAADRTGSAGKAVKFNSGANIEVPYNTALNPTAALTIATWIKADVIKAGNRFLGLQSWIGYKFELQEANRSFLTIGYQGGAYDRDSEQNLPVNEWHHIVATYGGGKTLFYVDGTLVKTWENTPNAALSISGKPYNLVIGQDFPTDKYSSGDGANFDNVNSPDYHVIPLAWGGYFQGSLDELRMYKTVLTATQVASLYDREKP